MIRHACSCSEVLVTRIFSWCEAEYLKSCEDFVTFYKFLTDAEVLREGSNPRGVVGEVRTGGKRSFSWMRYERLSQKFSQAGTKAQCKSSSRTMVSHGFASVSLARRRKLLAVGRLLPSNSFHHIYTFYWILDNATYNCIRFPAVFLSLSDCRNSPLLPHRLLELALDLEKVKRISAIYARVRVRRG